MRRNRLSPQRRQYRPDVGLLPQHEKRRRQLVDDPGYADHQRPCEGYDADHVVQIEPLQPRRTRCAQRAEIELSHEGPVNDRARCDGDHEQERHQPHEELAGKPGEQVPVQRKHDVEKAFSVAVERLRLLQDLARMRVEADPVRRFAVRLERVPGRRHEHDDLRLIVIREDRKDDLARIHRPAPGGEPVEADIGGSRRYLRIRQTAVEQGLEFVLQDERQPADANDQEGAAGVDFNRVMSRLSSLSSHQR